MTGPACQAVLFDLDGTLIDSAPDLAGAANDLRLQRGMAALPYEHLRPMVGAGARGMVGVAFGITPEQPGFEALRDAFLDRYAQRLLCATRTFDTVEPLLLALERLGMPWGIVTNKAHRFTDPIVAGLGLERRAKVVIAGDTTARAKPHPDPLLEAARRLALPPQVCVYVGDDQRDVQAGRAAGMGTVAAAWGYLGQGEPIDHWGADCVIQHPADLLTWLDLA